MPSRLRIHSDHLRLLDGPRLRRTMTKLALSMLSVARPVTLELKSGSSSR
jgi:hypothetical protein